MRRGNNKFGVDRQVQERVKNISDYWNDNTINLETILFGTENERAGLRGMKAL